METENNYSRCRIRKLGHHESSLRLRNGSMKTIGIVLAGTVVVVLAGLLVYVAFLNQGRLRTVDLIWVDHHPTSGLPYVHLEGTVVNSGSSGARSVQLVTRIYDSEETSLRIEITDLGDIPAGAYRKISLDIQYSGKAAKCEATLRWKPFGG